MEINEGGCHYRVVNTRNEGNVGIGLDRSEGRDEHNQMLCKYLKDDQCYNDYLVRLYEELAMGRMMPQIDRTIHPETLLYCTKKIVRAWIKRLRKQDFVDDYVLMTFLRNSTRNKLLLRALDYRANGK